MTRECDEGLTNSAAQLVLSERERVALEELAMRTRDVRVRRRARGVLLLGSGQTLPQAAAHAGMERETLRLWVARYVSKRSPDALQTPPQRTRRVLAKNTRLRSLVKEAVAVSPKSLGYNSEAWTPRVLRQHLFVTERTLLPMPTLERLLSWAQAAESSIAAAVVEHRADVQ